MSRVDVVVIGAGPAGEVVAGRIAERGERRVVLVEQELVGGECSFYACMPSKALLRPAQALAESRRVPGAAQAAAGALDAAAALARRDEVIHGLDDSGQLGWLEKRGIELVRGRARLDGERRVRVGDAVFEARDAVVLAVGSGPAWPPIPGLADVAAWSNREATTARSVPRRLCVLGGGVVGVELAQAWASLGARVTVIEAGERLVAGEEPLASELVEGALRQLGVDVRTAVAARAVARHAEEIVIALDGSGGSLACDRLLVAVGRRPRTEGLNLESVGLTVDGPIAVDDAMRVPGLPWLYAVGDVNGRALLTHAGKYQARVAADAILGERASAVSDHPGAPRVVFTEPQIAAVGLTLAAAREAGIDAVAIDLDTGGSAGASFHGRGVPGTTRFVLDPDREVLVGATFTGADVAELLHAATIAVACEVPLARLAHAIAPFPTRSELWTALIEAAERELGHSLHAAAVDAAVSRSR